MKQFKLFLVLFALGLFTVSCGGDDDDLGSVNCSDSVALSNAIADEINAISTATSAYFNDMSSANCQALKDAYQAYIDELKNWQSCANQLGQGSQWQQDLATAEADIDNLC